MKLKLLVFFCLFALGASAQQEAKPAALTLDKAFVDKILNKKFNLLKEYISILVKKDRDNLENVVNEAMKLWNNDNKFLVTIKNKGSAAKPIIKPVRPYFSTMGKLPYKNVDITYRNYVYVGNIIKQPDGTYKGVVTFQQEFVAFDAEGNPQYHDIIDRTFEIIVVVTDVIKDGQTKETAEIFFGNMGVTDTRI